MKKAIKHLKDCDLSVLKNATASVNNQVKKILSKEKVKKITKPVAVKEVKTEEEKQ